MIEYVFIEAVISAAFRTHAERSKDNNVLNQHRRSSDVGGDGGSGRPGISTSTSNITVAEVVVVVAAAAAGENAPMTLCD
ncbi:hypothetical protein DPMN_184547, partial [Dreissena polymorpha]